MATKRKFQETSNVLYPINNTEKIRMPETDGKVAHELFIFNVFDPVPRNQQPIIDDVDNGVSTKLELYNPWTIRKRLTASDASRSQARLLVPINSAETHVVRYLRNGFGRSGGDRDAEEVKIWDADTKTSHSLTFTRWSSGSYLFIGKWTDEFIERRKLMKGDEIGLFWEESHSRLNFCVLSRAAAERPSTLLASSSSCVLTNDQLFICCF